MPDGSRELELHGVPEVPGPGLGPSSNAWGKATGTLRCMGSETPPMSDDLGSKQDVWAGEAAP